MLMLTEAITMLSEAMMILTEATIIAFNKLLCIFADINLKY